MHWTDDVHMYVRTYACTHTRTYVLNTAVMMTDNEAFTWTLDGRVEMVVLGAKLYGMKELSVLNDLDVDSAAKIVSKATIRHSYLSLKSGNWPGSNPVVLIYSAHQCCDGWQVWNNISSGLTVAGYMVWHGLTAFRGLAMWGFIDKYIAT